jgi:2-oxoglutarate ferredoxin oxidoreductase subunit alpha
MTRLRAEKVAKVADDIPALEVDDPDGEAELLVLGWGSTYGAIVAGARRTRRRGGKVATAHLFHLNPLPRNIGDVLGAYDKVLVPEMNTGQLWRLLRAEFLVDATLYSKVQGQPIFAADIEQEIERLL